MEAIYSSENPVDFQRITGRYIPEDSTPYSFLINKYLFQQELKKINSLRL
jgi:hypothetical protein